MSARYSGFDVERRTDSPNMPLADARHPITRHSRSDTSARSDDTIDAHKRHGNRPHAWVAQGDKQSMLPRQIIGLLSDPKTHSPAHCSHSISSRLKERPPTARSAQSSLKTLAPISSIYLPSGQPRRTSGERESERNYMDQRRCMHRPRRTRCSAKHTWRVSG